MGAFWMFMILLSCSFSQATESQSVCSFEDKLSIICVSFRDNVTIPCPKLTEDVSYTLLKEEKRIFNSSCNSECKSPLSREGFEPRKNSNISFSFALTRVNVNSYGIYRCEGLRNYPPPVQHLPSPQRILVLVEGHHCRVNVNYNCNIKSFVTAGAKEEVWPWIVGLVSAVIYGLVVSIIAVFIWVKCRRSDFQSDYINTAPREGRKKRGIQMPIPRHF